MPTATPATLGVRCSSRSTSRPCRSCADRPTADRRFLRGTSRQALVFAQCAAAYFISYDEATDPRCIDQVKGSARIATSPVIRQKSPSSSRMLPNQEYPISQCEPLIGIIRNRRIQRSMPDRNAGRRRNHPSNMLLRVVPHLNAEGEVAGNVVEVRIGELPKQFIHSEVRRRAGAP